MLSDLQKTYETLNQNYSTKDRLDFIRQLLSSNEPDILDFHYALLGRKENQELFLAVRSAFINRSDIGLRYLLDKIETETDEAFLAETMQILGHICSKKKTDEALPYAKKLITHPNPDIRYRASITIGWIGKKEDLEILKETFLTDNDPFIRDMAASAMQQVWFRMKDVKEELLAAYLQGLRDEENEKVILCIIGCLQNLLDRKFGVKEDYAVGFVYKKDIGALKAKVLRELRRRPACD